MGALEYLLFLCGLFLGIFISLIAFWFYIRRQATLTKGLESSMKEAFSSLSKETLISNVNLINSSLKTSLEQLHKVSEHDRALSNEQLSKLLTPLKDSLLAVDKKVGDLETIRQGAYSGLFAQIEGLLKSQHILHKETQDLNRALNAPVVRGRWGEMQLRRVVELSGLESHCDFLEQLNIKSEDETLRPDMVVTMPNNKTIVVDAKAPLEVFGFDETQEKKNDKLASSLRRHVLLLKKKDYFKHLTGSPEFTVMFLPGEAFLNRALVVDPHILDFAIQNDIMIATPTTLVALLKAVAFGFKQENIANNIEEVRRLAAQLIDRVQIVSKHFEKLGRHLTQATHSYNQTLSSLDSRVLVTARKIADLKAVGVKSDNKEEPQASYIELMPRQEMPAKEAQDGM